MGETGPDSRPASNPQSWSDWPGSPEGDSPVACGSTIRGRFVLEELIGAGGMGEVYRALDLRRQEAQDRHPHVAIKILSREFRRHPDALRALQRESRKAQKLAHPNICTVFDFDRDGASVYLVMELLEGRPLNEVVKAHAGTGLGREPAFELIGELGIALAHAHSRGIVHSDFKPSNVFLTGGGEVKVLDFGIARAARPGPGAADATQTVFDPAKLGAATLAYASPEQLLGISEPDPRDDVYSFAVVAYELLAGRHPFDRRSALEAQLQEMQVAQLPELTEQQNAVLGSALAFNRERRPASINDFVVGLGLPPVQRTLATTHLPSQASGDATRTSVTGPPPPGPAAPAGALEAPPPPVAPRPARRIALLAAGIGAVLLLGGTYYTVQSAREREAQQRQLEEQERREAEARIRQEQQARLAAEQARREAELRAAAEQEARALAERERLEAEAQAERERLARAQAEQESARARRAERTREASPRTSASGQDATASGAAPAAGGSPSAASTKARAGAKPATVYRWRDDAGEVHYGSQVPPQYADRAVAVVPDG